MATIEKIFSEVAAFSKIMGGLHNDFLEIVQRDIDRFLKESNDLYSQMQWQGWTTLGLNTFSASLSIAGALIPKSNGIAALDARSAANAGPGDAISKAMEAITTKLKDNDFLRTTCKTSAKFFNGVAPAADVWYRSRQTQIEARRSLLERVNLQNGQQGKSNCDTQVQQAQNAILRILEGKSKGG